MVDCGHGSTKTKGTEKFNNSKKRLTIALAGNANVGKSVIFNQLTGSSQIIGNWPGKTVERAEGFLRFDDYDIRIVDLPGIYSLSTFSIEEIVSRKYIAEEKPDVVINVVDASVLERNLFFTLQLMEMEVPLVVCLNQMDTAQNKGIIIDVKKLEDRLGVPVVPTVGIKGKGIQELVRRAIETAEGSGQKSVDLIAGPDVEAGGNGKGNGNGNGNGHRHQHRHGRQKAPGYGDGLETAVDSLTRVIDSEQLDLAFPTRWVSIKLLEGDSDIRQMVGARSQTAVRASEAAAKDIETAHREPSYTVIASERYALASSIAASVQRQEVVRKTFSDRLDYFATHKVFGYVTSVVVLAGLLLWTFTVGTSLSGMLSNLFSFFEMLNPELSGPLLSVLWNGAFAGLVAGITLVIPYVIPFYLVLALIEDSGILTRVAFMFDNFMHKIGLHGKAIIPLILSYGCNVPAIYTSRVMGSTRERKLAAFAITLIPCTARTIIILGLVAAFVNIYWALALYAIDLALVFVLGKIALKAVPGQSTGLIMEMHGFKVPSVPVVVRQTWARTKPIMLMVFPIYVLGGALVQGLYAFGWLDPINNGMSFLTVGWLGLPIITGVLLIFGLVRKEMIVLALVPILGTQNLGLFLTPVQFIVLALVGILYFPCLATFTALVREFRWRSAIAISAANLVAAVVIGGVAYRVLGLVF